MSTTKKNANPDWPKPGAGSWELDTAHFSADASRIARDIITVGVGKGVGDGMALIGGPLKTMEAAFVNGRFYRRLVPLIGGNVDAPPPPNAVLWLVSRLHPAFRRANKLAKSSLENRIWLDEFRKWEDDWKPALVSTSRRLAAVDPALLSDAELGDHLDALIAHLQFGIELHFRLHISDLGPIGLLLVRGDELGLDPIEVMSSLAGSSPATSAPAEALSKIRTMVEQAEKGKTEEGKAATDLDGLRALSPEIAAAIDEFLAEYGWRLTTGYDIRDLTLTELPSIVFSSIRSATSEGIEGEVAYRSLMEQVAEADRAELATLVEDARLLYALRDENGPLTYEWPAGLVRRGVLEIQKRLEASGRLAADPDSVFDLSATEMTAMLRGQAAPSVTELERRHAERLRWTTMEAPGWLGPEPPEPDVSVLPPAMARLMKVVLTVLDHLEHQNRTSELRGVGIGEEPYVGRACVVGDANVAITEMAPGDVLVAPYTVPTYNSVLAMAGAVVVDSGGLLCHAAVIAREYGIAGVVGVGSATSEIPHGAQVQVDPVAGLVTVLG